MLKKLVALFARKAQPPNLEIELLSEITSESRQLFRYLKKYNCLISPHKGLEIKKQKPQWDKYHIALYLLEEAVDLANAQGNSHLQRLGIFCFSEVYKNQKAYSEQLKNLCIICYYDALGLTISQADKTTLAPLAPAIIKRIKQACEKLNYDKEKLKEFYLDTAYELDSSNLFASADITWKKINRKLERRQIKVSG